MSTRMTRRSMLFISDAKRDSRSVIICVDKRPERHGSFVGIERGTVNRG
jgi:hypothetical protein